MLQAARLELFNKVSCDWQATQLILGKLKEADMAKSVGAGMGQAGWTVGSQPGRLSPSFAQLLNPHVLYVLFLACVFHNISTQGCIKWDPKECK